MLCGFKIARFGSVADTGNISTFIKVVYVDETKGSRERYLSSNSKIPEKAPDAVEARSEEEGEQVQQETKEAKESEEGSSPQKTE